MLYFELDNKKKKSLCDYKLCLEERVDIPSPEQEVETEHIAGRDGDLHFIKGYKDLELEVKLNALESNYKKTLRRFKLDMQKCRKIYFSDDLEVFYRVKYVKFDSVDNNYRDFYSFTATFVCDPFVYSFAGDDFRTFADSEYFHFKLKNEGYKTRPAIRVTVSENEGNGTLEFVLNGKNIRIENVKSYDIYTIDSETYTVIKEILGEETNALHQLSGDFPILKEGENEIQSIGKAQGFAEIGKFEIMTKERWL